MDTSTARACSCHFRAIVCGAVLLLEWINPAASYGSQGGGAHAAADDPVVDASAFTTSTNRNVGTQAVSTVDVFTIVAVVSAIVGGAATAAALIYKHSHPPTDENTDKAVEQLHAVLQRRHAMVSRDVMRGEGDIFAQWTEALHLTPDERQALTKRLQTPTIRLHMLRALDAQPLRKEDAIAFAVAFYEALRLALSHERFDAIATASAA